MVLDDKIQVEKAHKTLRLLGLGLGALGAPLIVFGVYFFVYRERDFVMVLGARLCRDG